MRSQTHVAVDLVREADGVVVRGRLTDDLGHPIARESVHLALGGDRPRSRTTDDTGAFEVRVPASDLARAERRHLEWRLEYDGDRVYGGANETGSLDLTQQNTRLAVRAEPRVAALDDSEVYVHADLTTANGPVPGVEVRVKVGDGTELVGRTGAEGRATFLIRAALLGSAGRYTISARFLGDHLLAPSVAETSLRVLLASRVTLRVAREGDARLGRYRFSGRLADQDGPIAGATVAILADAGPGDVEPHLVALTTTRPDGLYLAAVPAPELFGDRSGELAVRAVYSPDDQHQGATSHVFTVQVPPPPGVPTRWYLFGLAGALSLLLVAQAVRTRLVPSLLQRLRLRRLLRRRDPAVAATLVEMEPELVTPVADGDAPRRRDVLSGVVVDGHSREPLPGAIVTVFRGGDGAPGPRCVADARGHFELEPLAPGPWRLRLEAEGCLPREEELTVPHDGRYDRAAYALVAVRRRVREIYGRAVQRFGADFAWGADTPREAWERVRRGSPDEERALAELRELVEQAWFGEADVRVADAARAQELARFLEGRR
ncbi:MAG: carboxypeptidase regulatory-like domain-containing protein [Myxococcales bacterium]|nr:carboxypeptidase regulatory-like domain-containing protein [Myxococcales bacterium]